MDEMTNALRPVSGEIVQEFHSAKTTLRFGKAKPRVRDVEAEADEARRGAAAIGKGYDPEWAYRTAVASGWAYADGQTLADTMRYYGFNDGAHVKQISVVNEAMLVVARAYLIRSNGGRVGVLAFRGTEPVNAINWLIDADTLSRPFFGKGKVHHGFHGNVESLWNYLQEALEYAMAPSKENGDSRDSLQPLQHLYLTGHSLGGAMAVLVAARLFADPTLAVLAKLLRGVYTFGQPHVGDREFAAAFRQPLGGRDSLHDMLHRHEFAHDIVPCLPPLSMGKFDHFGTRRATTAQDKPWETPGKKTQQVGTAVCALISVLSAFAARRFMRLQPFDNRFYSIEDHLPQRYINTCKSSLPEVARERVEEEPGPIEQVLRIAHFAAEKGKEILLRGRNGSPQPRA